MKKIKFLGLAAFTTLSAALFTIGCGDDSGIINNNSTGWHPNLTFSPGQVFVYTVDSLTPTGVPIRKRVSSRNTLQAQTTYQGELCYPVLGVTYDSSTTPPTPIPEPPYWIRYDQTTGKYYQWGIRQLINITQPGSWDTVGNFDVGRGTSYFIGSINYTITIPGIGTVNFTGPLNGKIADSTTIQTTGNGESIPCYRIELTASISGMISAGTVSTEIIFDYYLGYASPTGIVELKLRPFSFTVAGIPNLVPQPGFDRKLYSHTP